jgi:hypothetical protein
VLTFQQIDVDILNGRLEILRDRAHLPRL